MILLLLLILLLCAPNILMLGAFFYWIWLVLQLAFSLFVLISASVWGAYFYLLSEVLGVGDPTAPIVATVLALPTIWLIMALLGHRPLSEVLPWLSEENAEGARSV